MSTVSMVIPNWNGQQWLPDCLAAVGAQDRAPDEVIVVDNGSRDGSVAYLRVPIPGRARARAGREHGVRPCREPWDCRPPPANSSR